MAKSKTKRVNADPLAKDLSYIAQESGKWVKFNDLFQLQKKNKTITIRVSDDLLNEVKKRAKTENTNYQKLIRNIIIQYLTKKAA